MGYLVLARKWRPRGFDDLVGQEPITRLLKNAVSHGKIAHAYLFSGPRGVGKTSSARILAKALNCKDGPTALPCGTCESCTAIADGSSIDVIEIDGASNNSVDDIRDLREKVKYAPSGGRYKVYIIDEAHMLSNSAFNALLKTLEEPPSHVIFVLATTEMKKIPATVMSRCQHMPFRRIPGGAIRSRLAGISEAEGIRVSPVALKLISRAADGSMRDSLTILDQLSSLSDEIREEDVMTLLGIADFRLLSGVAKALLTGNRTEILEAVNILSEQGADMRAFAKELIQFFRDLLVACITRNPEGADLAPDDAVSFRELISLSSEDQLTLMLGEVMKASAEVRSSASPRLALELALIRASFLSTIKPLREAIEKIEGLRSGQAAADADPRATKNVCREKGEDEAKASPRREEREGGISEPGIDISHIWEKTAAALDPPLSAVLQQAKVELRGDEINITLDKGHSAIFHDSIKENAAAIEQILLREAGKKLRVKLVTVEKKTLPKRELKQKALDEPLIKEALQLFEGRIVDVSGPVNNKNGGENV